MTINQDILTQFTQWLDEAKAHPSIRDCEAMFLATGGVDDRLSGRIVLLKEVDERGFVFYTNYNGRKSVDLTENPFAALTFYWEPLTKQLRIEGRVEKVDDAMSDAYFASRRRDSQIGAWASEQSEPLASREALMDRVKEYELTFLGKDVPRPPNWGGWRVVPDMVEFWSEGDFRLHQRDVWRLESGVWNRVLLNP